MIGNYQSVPVDRVMPNPDQPRKAFSKETIDELAESIRANGLINPITVEPGEADDYILIAGERRLRAFRSLGLAEIPAIIQEKSNHNGREAFVKSVVENIQRENMNPIDEARAYQRLYDEYHLNWTEVSLVVGKSIGVISQATVLLKLEPEIVDLIAAGKFTHSAEVARMLLRIPDSAARVGLVQRMAGKQLTGKQIVAAAEKLAEMLSGQKIVVDDKAKSPVMKLTQYRHFGISDDDAPSGWDAMQMVGKVPPWKKLVEAITASCNACALASMASATTCKECPLVDTLGRLVSYAR